MKELSIEEKAQRYDETLDRTIRFLTTIDVSPNEEPIAAVKRMSEYIFPELKESEDEKIRKGLIGYFRAGKCENISSYHGISTNDILAWLETQGESYTKRDVDDAYLKGVTNTKNEIEKQYEANYQIRKDIATFIFNYKGDIKDRAKWIDYLGIKVYFVEPKFHEGDWIIGRATENEPRQIAEITEEGYKSTYGGWYGFSFEEDMHLWTIQDAKDGDVLYMDNGLSTCIFIYKSINNVVIQKYASYNKFGFEGTTYLVLNDGYVCPATKEQRDLLFAKMKEAGYEWNADKKELKKIVDEEQIKKNLQDNSFRRMFEQKSAWSEEDKCMLNNVIDTLKPLRQITHSGYAINSMIDWLKSLKDRVQH